MQLAVRKEDADILLKEKNVLDEAVLDKYRVAGQITQTGLKYVISLINDSYHFKNTEKPYSCQEICILGDSLLTSLLAEVYNNQVREKGIATPVSLELNEIVNNFAPEVSDTSEFYFSACDIVTISLGVHIDGYAANVSHTIVIYPPAVEIDNELKPPGPLLGTKSDAICAAHIATEAVVSLLGAAMSPEKIPAELKAATGDKVGGPQIRELVNSVAESFNCTVLPGSKVRRIRRFLAGQAEGVVAERDFKGVVWSESNQEASIISNSDDSAGQELILSSEAKASSRTDNTSAIPTDEFYVSPGEVYNIDIKMVPLSDLKEPGLVTLEEVDDFSGKNNKDNEFRSKATIFLRDYAVNYQLRLKSSRSLLGLIDKRFTVFPFKLSHTAKSFPIESIQDIPLVCDEIKSSRMGLSELANRHLVNPKPIQIAKFVPWSVILKSANPTGRHGIDANKPTLPGLEVPLPLLGVSALKLNSFLKEAISVPVAREQTTVILNSYNDACQLIRLTGGKNAAPSWIHSDYLLGGRYKGAIEQLLALSSDKRFGIAIKECSAKKLQAPTGVPAAADAMLTE